MPSSLPLPPGPRTIRERARAFRAMTKDPDSAALALNTEYGPLMSIDIGRRRIVLVADPELIGEMLLDKDAAFMKDDVTRGLAQVLGRGLLTSEGELWRRQRKLIAPSLGKKQVASYADAMTRHARRYAEGLRDGDVRNVHADMSAVTLEIVVDTLFGTALRGAHERVGPIVDAYMDDFHALVHSWRRLFPSWFPFAQRRRGRRTARDLDALVMDVVRTKRASSERGDDLLSRMLLARDEADPTKGMDDRQLRDEAITLFMAGHETTANALSWTLLLLAEHPEIDSRVAAEVEAVLEGGRAATADDVVSLPITRAVVDEAMRLYPPAHIIGREALRDVELGGFRIPKGTTVLLSPWAMHHDPRFFPDPEAFRPERWLDGSAARLPRYVYLPFGAGPRVCVGNHFALLETVLVLASIVQRVRFERVSRAPVPAQPAITLRPRNGLPLRVAPRARSHASPADPVSERRPRVGVAEA
jgi:cytochrome P450